MRSAFAVVSACVLGVTSGGLPAHAQLLETDGATLRSLDKITGRAEDQKIGLGEEIQFGGLNIRLRACYQSRPEDTPESAAFLEIEDRRVAAVIEASQGSEDVGDPMVFSGWMYASSPGLNALEHPVYDVWVIKCNALPPEVLLEYALDEAVTNDAGSVEGEAVIDTNASSSEAATSEDDGETVLSSDIEEMSLEDLLNEQASSSDSTESQE